ncbi:MAG: hypothetical protein JNL87_13575 [Burkholderiaceae bacterium]|nr:hypothetical protein [Burkholderiaceae bacterium]
MHTPVPFRRQLPQRAGSWAAVAAALLVLHGCGDDETAAAAPPAAAPVTPAATMIAGTVAVGAAVPGASVTVRDADAATADLTGTADADGAYALDVSSLKPPLLVSASGTLNGEPVVVVAVVPAVTAHAGNTANVTSLTNAVAALIAPGGDLDALASADKIAAVSASTVADASALLVNTLKSNPRFAALLGDGFDPLKTPFTANGSGIDAVLDQVAVEVGSSGVAITNLTAPAGESGQSAPVVLTAAQTSNPTAAPPLPASSAAGELPTSAEMLALAKKLETCLALPLAERVTMDAAKQVTAVSPACSFAPAQWKSDGGNWAERVGMNTLRYDAATGTKVGTPTIAVPLPAPNHGGNVFQHPFCNAATCVIMNIPMTSASGKPTNSTWLVGKIDGQWDYVGNQLPYAMGVEQRLNRKVAVNIVLAAANPSNFYLQDRLESVVRLTFNPEASAAADSGKVRAVVWKGPGLPEAGVVTHRSSRCGTADRFPITNQQGLLTVQNSGNTQWWNVGGGNEFMLDAAKLDGTALTMPTPSTNWATNATVASQEIRSSAFTGTIAAWSVYKAEIYHYANSSNTTPDEVIYLRTGSPFEPASTGAARSWPQLSTAFIDGYLKPTGAQAGSLASLAQTMDWSNPASGYVNFGYLFSQNRVSAMNGQSETDNYWKRANMFFRLNALGDTSAPGYEWAPNQAGTALSPTTETAGSNPNPRCGSDEVLPLDPDSSRGSYREAGLQFRGTDRKLYSMIRFWSN